MIMGCSACAKRRGYNSKYEARFSDGKTQVYKTEWEAKAAVARRGGTVRRVE